ncbi:cap-specific mRNA (nucleoside-2'-O-)-methyltransferase 1 isoform X1 [Vombatus ursinus]|uniref:cap-specific mRNA (nucleoside-2'-O-)-methyltransferase 1 isoform X1 n=1 Tax=Vombatus ursinus TaxID=29139 RepID=UPI000FFD01F3|nr:cap-specific mRNA (nucleoside-2'-O-)-methyltransferase 1 isoform X1 [Vombatus ursinus]
MGDPGGGGGRGRGSRAWCLRRVGMSAEWLLLEDRSEVTVGRGFDVTYQLLSKICPLMISRNHCVFKQNAEGQWTVMDNKSLNGVWLNKERLEPLKACPIREGDRIQLGVPLENKEKAEYEYEVVEEDWEKIHLCLALRNSRTVVKCSRTKRKCSLEESDSPGVEGSSDSRTKVNKVSHDYEQLGKSCGRAKMAKQAPESMDRKLTSPGPSGERAAEGDLQTVSEKGAVLPSKKQKGPWVSQSQSSLDIFKKTMAKILKLKVKVQEKQVAVLSVKQQSHKGAQKEMVKMEEELQELQDQLFTEQVQQQQRVEQLEKNFQEKKPHLEGLEKQRGEKDLKEQLAQALQEHHILMEELSRSKKDFEAIIEAKNKELELTKEEKEKVRAQKEEVLNQMNDVLENELQCIICSEHFIEAVTLNCAHSFCSYCINEWMKRKVECPICRQDIESKTRSLVLDNCISKMVEKLSSEMKERREILINERRVTMKRRGEGEFSSPQKKQKKRAAELGLTLSSTSDEEPPPFGNHGPQESSTSLSGSDSENEEKRPVSGSFSNDFKADSLVEGTSSRYSMYNSVSQKMMAKMGFREGEGLGKHSQGRKDIVEASNQKGRRGLGLTLKGFDQELNVDWRDEPEPSVCEQVSWFPECTTEIPDTQEMREWMTVGKRKMIIEDETEFCGEELLHNVLKCKSVFDDLDGEEMRRARTRSNPYEMIRGVFFLNRAAMKMANIDFVFDRMFTNPKDSLGKPLLKDRDPELLYFADVCAGPGGFSEYVLWRKKWHAKGFGMTLKGPNDFKLEDFYAASSELFEPYYGEGGIDGDGDITRPENITAFRNFVLDNTDRKGVHFMMADGGFSVEKQENLQEILSKQLLLCQFLTGLSVIRTGGHFICKTFDLFTPFSVGLIYLLYTCFERVSLFKPVTSRPANSERYVVCKSLKSGIDDVREYLFKPLQLADQSPGQNLCLCPRLVSVFLLDGRRTLSEPRQAEIRKGCLHLWGIPDQARVALSSSDPKSKFFELIKGTDIDIFSYKPTPLNSKTLDKIRCVLDYRCMVSGSEQKFLIGLGKSQIYTWDGRQSDRWTKLDLKTELPRDTLLSVEIVHELKGEGKAQRKISAIHILDALVLNGQDIREQHFNQRIQLAEKFVKAVSKPSRPDMNPIRVKEVYRLEDMEKIFVRLEMKVIKGSHNMLRLSYTGRDDRHFVPTGLYIVRTTNEPWTMAFSKSSNRKFFFNKTTGFSTFEMPLDAIAPFHICYYGRLFWEWGDGVRVHDSQKCQNPEKLSKDDILSFIREHSV